MDDYDEYPPLGQKLTKKKVGEKRKDQSRKKEEHQRDKDKKKLDAEKEIMCAKKERDRRTEEERRTRIDIEHSKMEKVSIVELDIEHGSVLHEGKQVPVGYRLRDQYRDNDISRFFAQSYEQVIIVNLRKGTSVNEIKKLDIFIHTLLPKTHGYPHLFPKNIPMEKRCKRFTDERCCYKTNKEGEKCLGICIYWNFDGSIYYDEDIANFMENIMALYLSLKYDKDYDYCLNNMTSFGDNDIATIISEFIQIGRNIEGAR